MVNVRKRKVNGWVVEIVDGPIWKGKLKSEETKVDIPVFYSEEAHRRGLKGFLSDLTDEEIYD
jgi:hypothetical protein